MWTHLRLAAIRGWAALRQRGIALVGRLSPNTVPHEEHCRNDARARFWAGVQEGRREAEANCEKRRSS
jgi:hypothetical protein